MAKPKDPPSPSLSTLDQFVSQFHSSISENSAKTSVAQNFTLSAHAFLSLLKSNLIEDVFKLMERNMRELYEESGIAWNEKEKRKELRDSNMRFLLLHTNSMSSNNNNNETLVGFLSFATVLDPVDFYDEVLETTTKPVIYLYEIQIAEEYRGKGLGTYLMEIFHFIGREVAEKGTGKLGIKESRLTVFKKNGDGQVRKWYEKLDYKVIYEDEEVGYVIMEKSIF